MPTYNVKKSTARLVTKHTALAAFSTVDCYGVPVWIAGDLQADLHELDKLENIPLVEAAQTLVKIAIKHSISPSEITHTLARNARDILGDLLINTKEIKG